MPELPTIFARTRPAELSLPRAPDAGGPFFEKLAQVAGHIQQGYELSQVAQLRGEGAASLGNVLNDAKIQNADPETYLQQATEAVNEAHQSTLDKASTGNVRMRLQAELTDDLIRARTHIATEYQRKKVDQAKANHAEFYHNSLINYGNEDSEIRRENIKHDVGQRTQEMVQHNFLSATDAQKELIDFDVKGGEQRASNLIDQFRFSDYDRFSKTPEFQNLPADMKRRLNNASLAQYNRMNAEGERVDKVGDNAWLDKNLKRIRTLKNEDGTDTSVEKLIDEFANQPFARAEDVLFVQKKIKDLARGGGGDSSQAKQLLADYENDVLSHGGISSPAIAAKWQKAVNQTGLNAAGQNEVLSKITRDLLQAQAIGRTTAAYARATEAYQQRQDDRADRNMAKQAKEVFSPLVNPLDPANKKDMLSKYFGATAPTASEINTMIQDSVAESKRTGTDVRGIANRKVQEWKKLHPPPAPALSKDEAQMLDAIKKMAK
ncbi:MAG: hypothetical protein C5B60_07060 [Chloroflexi bacterium]|nr:MAG: hypothetical protein C5B60_07060 [Chloroflexota bacterium]